MLKPDNDFTPSMLENIEDSAKYSLNQEVPYNETAMKIIGKVAEGYLKNGSRLLYARVRYLDQETNLVKVGYATEVLG